MKIYVASSWRNTYQPLVVDVLRKDGHEVYDFKDSEGFHWGEVDANWGNWSPSQYIRGLKHEAAERGFARDMKALRECDACVYVMPCGPSASMEMGWAVGAGKTVIVYIPELRDPDLMVKMAHFVTADLTEVRLALDDPRFLVEKARDKEPTMDQMPRYDILTGKTTYPGERVCFPSVGPTPDVVGWEPKIPGPKQGKIEGEK